MYVPAHFSEQRSEVLQQLIRERPLGTLITLGSTGLNANHLPFELAPESGPSGMLRGHVARANPVWRDYDKAIDALVIFQGPSTYVSPAWYPTKNSTGEVVPTYNYITVHAYGPLHIVDDSTWLRGLVSRLTDRFEANRSQPWQIGDAPESFINQQLQAIVGIEIPIAKLVGKWKLSQNRPEVDRIGVVTELGKAVDADSLAIAELVRQRSKI
ncbi:MAG TPA: FMN-binding negative transcriptional regulator [Candidatus Binatus sp.]|nr:FMN-binding negative transcriptional regulator [Candidatus Binatus sp.]